MSEFYAENNAEGSLKLFNKRTIYRTEALSLGQNIVDFNFGEKGYYGKVDNYFAPIVMEDRAALKPVGGGGGPARPHYALNFVADLFNEMVLEFTQRGMSRQIHRNDPYLSELAVQKGYESPAVAYNAYKNIFYSQMRAAFQAGNIVVEDFEQFMKQFMKIAPRLMNEFKFTYPGYVRSLNNSIMSSGLAIEIADIKCSNDEEKKSKFLDSPNWPFFVNACNKYGFLIDYNVPWRVVCDIKAPEVQPYMQKYGYSTPLSLLETEYKRASFQYLRELPAELLNFYNTVKVNRIVRPKHCNGKLTNEVIIPKTYTVDSLMEKFSSLYFVRTYLQLRLWEEKPQITRNQRKRLIRDVLTAVEGTDSFLPVEIYFERFINKPFDKPYSVGYIVNVARPAQIKKAFSRGEISAYSLTGMTTTGY